MSTISIFAHFDGTQIRLDEPYTLKPNTKLLVTLLSEPDSDREEWLSLSSQKLAEAYADEEPEYDLVAIREMNPDYERR